MSKQVYQGTNELSNKMNAAEDMYEVLSLLEWQTGQNSFRKFCAYCNALQENGHDQFCKLDKALRKAQGQE